MSTFGCSDYSCHNHDTALGAVLFFFICVALIMFVITMNPGFMASVFGVYDEDGNLKRRSTVHVTHDHRIASMRQVI